MPQGNLLEARVNMFILQAGNNAVGLKTEYRDLLYVPVDWFGFAQNRYEWQAPVNTVQNIYLPQNAKDLLTR
jgi:hypothetical protein